MLNSTVINGNCLEVLRTFEDSSVDAVVTDPPYGLGKPPDIAEVLHSWLNEQQYHAKGGGFMGKSWDAFVPGPEVWRECLRVLKPGGHLLSFFGTRTYDVGAMAIRIAGFEIRDQLAWVYGSGFPKSTDISKRIDKEAGAKNITAPATPEAKQWEGWGSALKPAQEPICLARKPLEKGLTLAANVQMWGTGGLNVDASRIAGEPWRARNETGLANTKFFTDGDTPVIHKEPHTQGRWPANLVHDGSEGVLALFPETKSGKMKAGTVRETRSGWAGPMPEKTGSATIGDSGSAARFFYCAKASKEERNAGLGEGSCTHPTVKPIALMRWLVRMVTPPGGTVLDPFCGSGTTGIAAKAEGVGFTGIEMDEDYCAMARLRIGDASGAESDGDDDAEGDE